MANTSAKHMMADSRLYFVCEARPGGRDPFCLLEPAITGGVDVIQLREKDDDEEEIAAAAGAFSRVARAHGIPFILNDRPGLARRCGADGVHVGQEDAAVARAREAMDDEAIVGLSTHGREQLEAAIAAEGEHRPDYISVGPVWQTPTKPARPAAGIEYVRLAAREADLPWFAIGGIGPSNLSEVLDAGARRIVVVRAIRDAADPAAAAAELRRAIDDACAKSG